MGSSSNLSSITINVGSNENININQPVIFPEGVIGKTILVGKSTSLVQLITDVNYRASVRIYPSGSIGIIRYLRDDICEVREVQKNAEIKLGDAVLTSGFSDIYPSNLKIGHVIEIQDEISSFQKIVKVRVSSNIGSLLNVFVVREDDNE
jgi:Cell shape-determining protein